MRLDQHVGNSDLVFQIRARAAAARVFMRAEVIPGPSIERAVAHTRLVVRNEIVAEASALIGRAPKLSREWMHGKANAVSDAGCVCPPVAAIGVEHEHV